MHSCHISSLEEMDGLQSIVKAFVKLHPMCAPFPGESIKRFPFIEG